MGEDDVQHTLDAVERPILIGRQRKVIGLAVPEALARNQHGGTGEWLQDRAFGIYTHGRWLGPRARLGSAKPTAGWSPRPAAIASLLFIARSGHLTRGVNPLQHRTAHQPPRPRQTAKIQTTVKLTTR